MPSKDPFDKVLRALGLVQQIQSMNYIRTAAIPESYIETTEFPCRIRSRDPDGKLLILSGLPPPSREQLVLPLIKFIHPTPETATRIRPISLILTSESNGTVDAEPVYMLRPGNLPGAYPARYRIPPSTISDLSLQEQVWRAEKFAMGTLLYEVLAGCRIFEGASDAEIQDNYISAKFPELDELPNHAPLIYACWSAAFGDYIALGKFRRYVHDNHIRFGVQTTFAVVSTAAMVAVPVLGAVGFSAIGPVAGSAAAGWQASIGSVGAGSLFAFCQSAAMGGAAATGIAATGAASAILAAAVTALPDMQNMRETFIRTFRRGPKGG